jgi:hypothetical protein
MFISTMHDYVCVFVLPDFYFLFSRTAHLCLQMDIRWHKEKVNMNSSVDFNETRISYVELTEVCAWHLFSSVNSVHRKVSSIYNVMNWLFYIPITCSLKMLHAAAVCVVKYTKWQHSYADLNPLDYHMWNEFKQLVYKNWTYFSP